MKRIEQLFADETGTTDGDGYELVIIHANAPEAGEAWRQNARTISQITYFIIVFWACSRNSPW